MLSFESIKWSSSVFYCLTNNLPVLECIETLYVELNIMTMKKNLLSLALLGLHGATVAEGGRLF